MRQGEQGRQGRQFNHAMTQINLGTLIGEEIMNQRKIWFAGIVTAALGTGIGLVLARIVDSPYSSKNYQNLERTYMIICGTGGLIVGTTQEALRQLQSERDHLGRSDQENQDQNSRSPSSNSTKS